MNLTLTALVSSYFAFSPMLMVSPHSYLSSSIKVDQFSTRNFFSTFLFSQSNTIHAQITRSSFANFIQRPLVFQNSPNIKEVQCSFTYDGNLTEKSFDGCHAVFKNGVNNYPEVLILDCTFANNTKFTSESGGAIYFELSGSLTVFGTFFKNFCGKDGGAIFAAKNEGISGTDMNRQDAQLFHSHYCCYSSCSATGYGSAALIASTNLQLNFSSTLNCPDVDKTAAGAQFDLQSIDGFIASSNINSTTGNSRFCAALEYRKAQSGFFKYQTIVNQEGGFITSFTDLKSGVDISCCNIVNCTLKDSIEKDAKPGVIHIRYQSIEVSKFFFFGINLGSHSQANFITYQNKQALTATLIDSFVETTKTALTGFNTVNVELISPDDSESAVTTQFITQLYLGDCKGILSKEPPPIIPTQTPTQSASETPSQSPSQSPSETEFINETDLIPDDSDTKEKGTNIPLIAGASAAGVAAVIAIALAAFFLIRRNRLKLVESDLDLQETHETEVNQTNPLYNKAADDPFQDDFVQ